MGDVADAIFFVKSGELVCHTGGMNHEDKIRLKAGSVFGESCLEPDQHDAVRKANVVAVGKCKVLRPRCKQCAPLTAPSRHHRPRTGHAQAKGACLSAGSDGWQPLGSCKPPAMP